MINSIKFYLENEHTPVLVEMCREILEWHKTGIIPQGKVKEFVAFYKQFNSFVCPSDVEQVLKIVIFEKFIEDN